MATLEANRIGYIDRRFAPLLIYSLAVIVIYGAAASIFCGDWILRYPQRDLWQHVAAVQSLIDNPWSPSNPFIPGGESSRHFQLYWLCLALVARAFELSAWTAVKIGAFATLAIVAMGIWVFGRAYFRSPWGPLALFTSMTAAWFVPIEHTGFHSFASLLGGAALPATLLIGLTLILWGRLITNLERDRPSLEFVPIVATMLITHQLGAVIGFIGACTILLLNPSGSRPTRIKIAAACLLGVAVAMAWPFFNPIWTMFDGASSSWVGPPNFYSATYLFGSFVPSSIGMFGLFRPAVAGTGRPLMAALAAYILLFCLGLVGPMTAARFLMPAVLVLHIGFAGVLLRAFSNEEPASRTIRWALLALLAVCLFMQGSMLARYYQAQTTIGPRYGNLADHAWRLTADLPDQMPVAAYDVAAWPVVAVRQRVLSTPWPEPLIRNLSSRQLITERLFDPSISRVERVELARRYNVRALIVDERYTYRRDRSPQRLAVLSAHATRVTRSGPIWRFDLR